MGSPMPLSSHSSDTWPTRAGTAQSAVCKGLNRWRSEFHSLPTRESASLGLRFLTSAVGMATSPGTSGGVAGVPRIRSRLPQLLRRAPAPAPQAQVGGGGYSQLRSYFHPPFASPSARRSPPPPPPRPPPLAPGRRPFFTTSQPPGPAALADMTSAPLPPGFPARTAFPGCHVVAAAAAKQPGIRSPSAPPRGGSGEWPAAARPRPCG